VQVHTGSADPDVVLVSQFRPPLGQRCIELPAGLSDAGETPLESAVRELKEETGYSGTTLGTSPVIAGEPGLTNNVLRVVRVHVDGRHPDNRDPKPRPEAEVRGVHRPQALRRARTGGRVSLAWIVSICREAAHVV
jgi:8-oxo-dGTP pyrophosphatase MutT (NUDIX family)